MVVYRAVSRKELEQLFPPSDYVLQQLSVQLHAIADYERTDGKIIAREQLPRNFDHAKYQCFILPRSTLCRHGITFFQPVGRMFEGANLSVVPKIAQSTTLFKLEAGAAFAQMLVCKLESSKLKNNLTGLQVLHYDSEMQETSCTEVLSSVLWFQNASLHPFQSDKIIPIEKAELVLDSQGKKIISNLYYSQLPYNPNVDRYSHFIITSSNKIHIKNDQTGLAIWSKDIQDQGNRLASGTGIWDPGFCGHGQISLINTEPFSLQTSTTLIPALLLLLDIEEGLPEELCYNGQYQAK